MDQIKSLHPPVSTENSGTSDEELDSQDSLEMAMNWGRMELVIVGLFLPILNFSADFVATPTQRDG